MPRKPRHFLANVPCHIISRGNNHNVCFFADADYLFYLECLNDACQKYAVSVHAYVLMTNHVHNGNMTDDGDVNRYEFDSENRLTEVLRNDIASIAYDPNGRLYRTEINGQITYYLFDGDALVATYNDDNQITERFIHGDRVDEPLIAYTGSGVSTSQTQYLHADHQGSIIAVSDTSGNIVQTNAYDVYGVPATTNDTVFGYTGQVYLKDLDLYYYKARMYHPKLGRFLQTDPVGYEDQMNLYAYVGNDPVNVVDPTGMYGRGYGWSDDDWKKFDGSQKKAASDMSASASSMRKEAGGIKDGETSANGYSGSELNSMAEKLDAGAAALNDDGSGGYFANAVSSLEDTRIAEATIGGKDVSVDVNHLGFGDNKNSFYFGHESLHSAGLYDYYLGKNGAYRYGSKDEVRVYKSLSNFMLGKRYKNPDHVMSEVYP